MGIPKPQSYTRKVRRTPENFDQEEVMRESLSYDRTRYEKRLCLLLPSSYGMTECDFQGYLEFSIHLSGGDAEIWERS